MCKCRDSHTEMRPTEDMGTGCDSSLGCVGSDSNSRDSTMSWWGHTFIPVIQDTFLSRPWESNPRRAAEAVSDKDVAKAIDRMSLEKWQEVSQLAELI